MPRASSTLPEHPVIQYEAQSELMVLGGAGGGWMGLSQPKAIYRIRESLTFQN